ncbi:MAG: diguanylate cyclase [Gallionellaceae bacterium]|jgi:diguanylate cyclase (GGDEF)-like protein/PAS domain S-box-containing protein
MNYAMRFLYAVTFAFWISSPALALDAVTLQLKWTHAFQFAGYYAALEHGYYREAGLDVNIREALPAVDPVHEVTEGHAQYGVGTSSLLLERNAGKPVVVLAVIFQHSPYVLIARQTQNIHDIAGKRIMLEPQANELLAYLKNEGIPQDHLIRLEHSFDPQDLINGTVDAISADSFNQPYYLDRANFIYQTYTPRSAGIDFYGDNLFTSEHELKSHPDRVRAFRAASLRGWKYAMEHAEEVTGLILAKYTQKHPRQYHLFQARQMDNLIHPELIEIGYMHPGRWRHIADTYADIGMLPKDFPLDEFLYSPDFKLDISILYRGLLITLLLVAVTSAIAWYIYRINRKLTRSITTGRLAEQQEVSRSHILELLASDAPLNTILDDIVRGVEQANPAMLCSLMLLDSQGKFLLKGSAPSLPEFFMQEMNGIEIGMGVASCGTAAFTGQRVIVEDIQTHPYWTVYKTLAQKAVLASCWSEPIHSANGKVLGTFAIYHHDAHKPADADLQLMAKTANIAAIALDRNRADQAIKGNEKLLSDILENVRAYIYMKDMQGRYLYANRLLRELFNAPMEEIVGYDDSKFYDAATAAKMRQSDQQVLQQGIALHDDEESNPNQLTGQTSVYLTTKIPLRHEDGRIYALCGIATDITEKKDFEEHLRHMAQYDALTKLPNRALFSDRLQQTFTTARRTREHFGLMFIDLDKFKPVNDTYGHEAGDLLLKDAANRMQGCVRESDTVARIGGDEFVVLLASLKHDQDAHEVGEKIRHALNQPFKISGNTLNISSSIGIAIYPAHGDDEKELVKHADLAMYYAKENGRNNVTVYHQDLKDSK